ncbi:hypothetical protein BCR44DRAFT_224831 [Catenaria anguillulae PL171]|uniref:Uncharacterized protein n=1 Tax=Catenaria anguillulae PL171 TaxID=765915 RepID=A0A1Y2HGX0_9FUNG|nr:hypothetical protein BCR44DRAFT_224831 [Catenaria anguillulae PL171]
MVHSIPLSTPPASSSGAAGSSSPASSAAHGPASRPSWHALVAAFATTGLLLSSHTLVGELRRPALVALVHTLAIAILGKPLLPSLDSAVPALGTWSLALVAASAMTASYWALYLVPAHVFASLLLLEVPLVSLAMAIVGSSTHAEYAPGRAASALDGLTSSSGTGVPTYLSFGLIATGSLLIATSDLMATPLAIPVCVLALCSTTLAIVLLKSKPAFSRLSGKHALALTAPRSAAILAGTVLLVEIPTLSQLNQPLTSTLSSVSLSIGALSTVLAVIASVCGASPVNRAYSRSTVLGLTEVTLTAMASCMMAQPALTGSHAWAMFAGFLAALGGLFLYSSAVAKAQHYDRLDVPLCVLACIPALLHSKSPAHS